MHVATKWCRFSRKHVIAYRSFTTNISPSVQNIHAWFKKCDGTQDMPESIFHELKSIQSHQLDATPQLPEFVNLFSKWFVQQEKEKNSVLTDTLVVVATWATESPTICRQFLSPRAEVDILGSLKFTKESDSRFQAAHCLLLSSFSSCAENNDVIESAVPQLLNYMNNAPAIPLQCLAINIFANIIAASKSRANIVSRLVGLSPFVERLGSQRTEAIQIASSDVIAAISMYGGGIAQQIVDLGGVERLMEMVSAKDNSIEVKRSALWAIGQVASQNTSAQNFLSDKLDVLLSSSSSNDTVLRRHGLYALYASVKNHQRNVEFCRKNISLADLGERDDDPDPMSRSFAILLHDQL